MAIQSCGNKFFLLLVGLLTLMLFFPGPGLAAEERIKEIRIADGKGDYGYPNPYRHYPRGPGYVRLSWVFETLIWKDDRGYVPALAQKWSYDPATLTFTFDLARGVKWHDGHDFSADDVVFTVSYFQKHPYMWVPMESVAGAEAVGPYQVKIKLKEPYAPFLTYVAGTMPIIPRHVWQEVTDPKSYDDPKSFIGCGPYIFKDFNKTQGSYLFEAFNEYYQGRPKADRLIYFKAGKPLMILSSGRADLANIKPEMADLLKEKGLVVLTDERGWNKKLMINHRVPPFDDKRFRQALAYAIDQQEIIDKAHQGHGSPASYGLMSPDHEYYNPKTPNYEHNPEKARSILTSLGYTPDPDGFFQKDGQDLKIELLCSSITVAGERAADRDGEVIKKQFETAGIKVDLVNLEQATADSRVRKWEFQLAISGHGGLLGDASFLNRMIEPETAGSINSARYGANKELNGLLKAQILEMDPEKRKEIVWEIQKVYAEDLPAISLYYPVAMTAYNPGKGVRWYYTKGGISIGIPIAQNKMSLIK